MKHFVTPNGRLFLAYKNIGVFLSNRNTQRIIHIPFFTPNGGSSMSGKHELEVKLRDMLDNASSCIGEFIALGEKFTSKDTIKQLEEIVIPFVCSHLHGLSYRVIKGYAMVVMMMKLVRIK